MATLITGSGFIGSHAAKIFIERGEKPILYDLAPKIDCISDIVEINKLKLIRGNILNLPLLLEVSKKEDVDRIIHTVAHKGVDSPYISLKVNIEGTLNILDLARRLDIKKVVFCSSAVVYFSTSRLEGETIKEDFPLMTLSSRPKSMYATAKIAGEFLGLNYADNYGIDFVALRYAAVFGPWRCSGGPTQVLIRELIEKPLRGETTVIEKSFTWSGDQELIYIKDAAMGTVLACDIENPKTRVYNIGMGKTIGFKELITIIKKLIPKAKINIEGISQALYGLPYASKSQPLDLTKAREELGYKPKYDMEKSLRDYITWIKAHMKRS